MQKLTRLLVGSAVLATVALSAPETALATPTEGFRKPVVGTVTPGGKFTLVKDIYHLENPGNGPVLFDLQKGVDGQLCIEMREARSGLLLSRVCHNAGETGAKTLADRVPTGVRDVVLYAQEPLDANNRNDNQPRPYKGSLIIHE